MRLGSNLNVLHGELAQWPNLQLPLIDLIQERLKINLAAIICEHPNGDKENVKEDKRGALGI